MIQCKSIPEHACAGVFSPSEPITPAREERFAAGLDCISRNGFQIKLGRYVKSRYHYMAGTVEERCRDILDLARDPQTDFLIAAWGGKSCNQLVPQLPFDAIASARKPLLGFSDGAVLLNAVTAVTGLITVHGPNVAGKFGESAHQDLLLLRDRAYGRGVNLLGTPAKVPWRVVRNGTAEGRLCGGNLSTFTLGLVGSPYIPRFPDSLFFWESGGETIQIIDQYLTCLRNAGFFDSVRGMVIGDFIRPASEAYKEREPFEMLMDVLHEYAFPILYCPTFGHLPQLQNPLLPIGVKCRLDAGAAMLTMCESIIE